jgi:hypothetical protein
MPSWHSVRTAKQEQLSDLAAVRGNPLAPSIDWSRQFLLPGAFLILRHSLEDFEHKIQMRLRVTGRYA